MKNIRHWTPRYVWARIQEISYQRRSPNLPWLTRQANEFLADYLRPTDIGLEFGSGRSTLWFAERVARLVSIEHDRQWHSRVLDLIEKSQQSNIDYHLLSADTTVANDLAIAIRTILSPLACESFDFVLIDGIQRDVCTREALRLLKPGGLLIIDNVNRHIPSLSYSPHSRSPEMGTESQEWEEVLKKLNQWRKYWTSSGVTDTAFYFKPASA